MKIANFAGVTYTGNASFGGVNDDNDACIAVVADTTDVVVKPLNFKGIFHVNPRVQRHEY